MKTLNTQAMKEVILKYGLYKSSCSTKISRDPWIHKKKMCDICGFTTTEKETLDKHIIQAHEKK